MKKKLKWIIPLLLILVVGCALIVNGILTATVQTNNIFVKEITFSNGMLSLSGDFADSALDYKGYMLRHDRSKLYIQLTGSLLTFNKRDGSFNVHVDVKDLGTIQEIYLQDNSSQRLIWPK
ncbi:hypothetical protein ACFPYJ_20360 [Paenibacillus solisilvae]|uniref:Lipoprotein n=1 Tax=Paenibacillus solisilvae TaxID=2486751 RepID=A0ABW0W4S9_9BACL